MSGACHYRYPSWYASVYFSRFTSHQPWGRGVLSTVTYKSLVPLSCCNRSCVVLRFCRQEKKQTCLYFPLTNGQAFAARSTPTLPRESLPRTAVEVTFKFAFGTFHPAPFHTYNFDSPLSASCIRPAPLRRTGRAHETHSAKLVAGAGHLSSSKSWYAGEHVRVGCECCRAVSPEGRCTNDGHGTLIDRILRTPQPEIWIRTLRSCVNMHIMCWEGAQAEIQSRPSSLIRRREDEDWTCGNFSL